MGGSGTVMSAVSGVSSSSGGSSGQPTPIALVPNVIDSLSRLSSSQVNNYWKVPVGEYSDLMIFVTACDDVLFRRCKQAFNILQLQLNAFIAAYKS